MFQRSFKKLAELDLTFSKLLPVNTLFAAFKKMVPLVIINVYLHLFLKLFLDRSALIPAVFHIKLRPMPFYQGMLFLTAAFDYLVIAFVMALWTKSYLNRKLQVYGYQKDELLPVLINFALALSYGFATYSYASQSAIHIIIVIALTYLANLSFVGLTRLTKGKLADFGFAYLLWGAIVLGLVSLLYSHLPKLLISNSYADFFSQTFFAHWYGLLLAAIVAPILFVLGFAVPMDLTAASMDLSQVNSNMNAVYQAVMAQLPYPANPYSVLTTAAMLGGTGAALGLVIVLVLQQNKKTRRLGLFAFLPAIFDSSKILAYGYPLFLRPLMLVPMILASVFGTVFTTWFILAGWVRPTVFAVPNSTPHILLSFFASQTPYRSLAVTLIVLLVSVLIYWPFVKADKLGGQYE
ncbi:PTS sugar transporter subunit IIC [Fructobacillus sp. M2-14]|uniref:PTS sugar transporter subunit IIC n=1 Tax=Fructobacillus broussonetiae TaxID=2713173 RepID=A0ABS5R343_9LACO|nr:hypothetical protein [Fructobacillus broussonetiae]MBS9338577.1 PTS sugar transporter subunit IIC [Fructobacillus broussonetiae]